MSQEEQAVTSSDRPPYLHIADVLRGEIHDGVLRVGERLPAQAELEKRFNVSRPTVQRALTELRRGGYIDNQRGRSAQVLDRRGRNGGVPRALQDVPSPTFAVLETYLAEAFEARHVTVDAYSLSAETLSGALAGPLGRVLRGESAPESIRVRIMVPTLDATLAIPRLVDGDDDWPLERLRELARAQAVSLESAFQQVADVRPEIVPSVEMRTVRITPMEKLYLLNGRTVLTGRYRVVRRDVTHREHRGEIFDVMGVAAVLFPYRTDPGDPQDHGSRFVQESAAWFESLWTTIAEPLRLSG